MTSKSQISQKMTLFLIVSTLSWLCFTLSGAVIDITHILGQHPELSTFSNYLTQTNLVQDIDSRQTITVLAVANSDMGPLVGKSMDKIKEIMSVHVLLDYYDMAKLKNIQGKSLIVTTLLQASGRAFPISVHQGLINISVSPSGGGVTFGSGATGVPSHTLAQLIKPIVSEPYSISVLQVSSPIIASLRPLAALQSQSPSESQSPISHPPSMNTPPPTLSSPTHSPSHGTPASAPSEQRENAPSPTEGVEGKEYAPEPSDASIAFPPLSSFAPRPSEHANGNAPQQSQESDAPSPMSLSFALQPSQESDPPSPSLMSPLSFVPQPSQESDAPSPSLMSPLSFAPQPSETEAPTPVEDDATSPDGMSPADDSPSSAPWYDSPSMAPDNEDTDAPTSADTEAKKHKSAAPSSSKPWIGAIFLTMILGKLV